MPIRVALHHATVYQYDRLVKLGPHIVRLRPALHCRTKILGYSLRVEPKTHFLNWQQDPYNNYLGRLVFLKPARELRIEVDLVAEIQTINPFDFFLEESAERYPFVYEPTLARELVPYLETLPPGHRMEELIEGLRTSDVPTVDYLVELNRKLHSLNQYVIRMEPGIQTPEETLALGRGSCRDTSWLLVQVFRHLGLAARFVSGYLIQLKADVPALDGPSGPEQDFTDLHAWVEVYLPGAGWVGLDPTSGLFAGEGHIPLACAADPITAAPVTGSYGAYHNEEDTDHDIGEARFSFAMKIERVQEDPRVTKPYTEEQWRAIDELGRAIDERLNAGDVRLTMGGEPTFVSIDDMDGAEWKTAALGPEKRRRGGELLERLRDRFAPGGLLHFGQGKWYPGEPLPRWALGCYWRCDGVPLWANSDLVADERRDDRFGSAEARAFITALAEQLGVDPSCAQPGYEDAWYSKWKEQQLPTNVDPQQGQPEKSEDRAPLDKVAEPGLGPVVGYALPLRPLKPGSPGRWIAGRWFLRREHLFLIPGDSPMGYRLPLDSLPWTAPEDIEPLVEQDPFAPRGPLPSRPVSRSKRSRPVGSGSDADSQSGRPGPVPVGRSDKSVIRTTLCVEPRDGRLHVFMPPQQFLEDYIELVHAIEATAEELGLPVRIEGYTPPHDPRINHFSVTPDPGVIEVNIHPAHSWEELAANTNTIYEEARLARLGTEKFQLDGRHTGTGGGNHVLIGGPTAADSPVLRRPDLLRSLLGFWNNHPSLSYLFSSLFVGPHSQAPRIDEARNDSLYELEIAFRQVPDRGVVPPWLVDRLFRHILADVTGNTHRAEFCIDKLFSPDTASGRRGLVELRAFEMPPHARMSLVQQLLIRGLVAKFWDEPYTEKLVDWGTTLHDRFVLPHFVAQDFRDVLEELRRDGFPFDGAWFAPHFEFRFPAIGRIELDGLVLELRQAIEPWHVLGEEPAEGATARYVDSSVERLQVQVQGLTDARHVVTCNGRRVPLFSTGTRGEFVAGVRYRAWQPPSCLHPTIPVQAPLVFDLWDSWLKRSVGGCTYHVSHPGGLAFEAFPVNASEAESRRHARFFAIGHTPGPMSEPPAERNPVFPLTLDLRWPPAAVASPEPGLATLPQG
jgi:uncharacterized protein (DUF2126 family)/transglutaminase-like putative cysteine protease